MKKKNKVLGLQLDLTVRSRLHISK